jgi:phospholipid transport system substrate-binding protein
MVLMAFVALSLPPAVFGGEPTEQLRVSIDQVVEVLNNSELKSAEKESERRAVLRRIVDRAFDWEEMARRSLARHWRDRSPEERKEFVVLYADLLERTYIKRIERYDDEQVVYYEEKLDDDYAVVKTKITSAKGVDIPVDYRLRNKGAKWRVYDVVVEGVSLINNYRTQFSKILQSGTYEDLVKRLKEKLEG